MACGLLAALRLFCLINILDDHHPGVRQLNSKPSLGHRRPVYLSPIDGWSNNKTEKRKATNDRELSSEPYSSSKRLKESPSKPGPQAREKGKAEDEPEAQVGHRSEPNETVQDNLDDSGSEYAEDEDDLDIDEDEDGEYESEENDQEEERWGDGDDDEYLTDESEEEEN
ncbi:hypothetical protein BGZ46_009668 [Entomortierella lignicola]|nr:hypothetical protein BGZ46_009668 [Entomortierella lignicola]